MTFRFRSMAIVALSMLLLSATLRAQSESDVKTMEHVRALYSTGPVPGSISCAVTLDWDGFFKRMNLGSTDDVKALLDTLKQRKIAVVSEDATNTEVKVDAGDPKQLWDGLRQQLQGFFRMYWSLAYGRLIVKQGDRFQLTNVPEGYVVKSAQGPTTSSLEMDKAYLIKRVGVESPQLNAAMTLEFKPGDDRLLRLRTIDETIEMGSSKMVVSVSFDYQKIGIYEIPQHMNMALAGSYSFDYTLSGCEVREPLPLPVRIDPPPTPAK